MLAESFLRSGKVRDLYRLDDGRIAAGRVGPDQRVRRRPADVDPGQGPRPDRPLAVLVRRDRRRSSRTTSSTPTRRSCETIGAERRAAGGDPADLGPLDDLRGRIMICRPAAVVPIEAVVRGYLAGSGWKEYQASGTVCGDPAAARAARERPAARADLHARDEGRAGRARREHRFDRMIDARRPTARIATAERRAAGSPRRSATWPSRSIATARPSPRGAGSSWPTRSSSSAWLRRRSRRAGRTAEERLEPHVRRTRRRLRGPGPAT